MTSIRVVTFLLCLAAASSAPTIYDQRQDGKLNVHADLENFLIVVATNGKANDFGLVGSLALQQLMEARQKAHQGAVADKFEYKLEESSSDEGKEPYSVEILKLGKEHEKLTSDPAQSLDQVKPVVIQEHVKPTLPEVDSQVRDSTKKEEDDAKTIELKIFNLPRRRLEHEPKHDESSVKVPQEASVVLPAAVPSTVFKIKPEEEDKEARPMKLLGDGIEDCGPGRSRNKLGICEADKQTN